MERTAGSPDSSSRAGWGAPALAVLAAVITTTAMDANGLSMFSALPLLGWLIVFWVWRRYPRLEVGFTWGTWRHHGLALLHPLAVIVPITALAALTGAIEAATLDPVRIVKHLLIVGLNTALVVTLTEEGFFRGWLWAAVDRAGTGFRQTLLATSLLFALWHASAVLLETGFNPPPSQVPLYLVNTVLMGAIWGTLRYLSGSVLVASVGHGAWNGFAYVLYGFGQEAGALGVQQTGVYGPELGILGLIGNGLFLAWLLRRASIAHRVEARHGG